MFTGIVEETGRVVDRRTDDDGVRLRIAADLVADGLERGQSVAVAGACLTVERTGPIATDGEAATDDATDVDGSHPESEGWFETFLARETVERTYLGALEPGDGVNLERAMPASGRFDGHVVQGHVDAVATVEAVEDVGEDWRFTFAVPPGDDRYVVEKGSVALDGVSLTVADRTDRQIAVAIVPTTYERTTLSTKEPGEPVHLEVDVIAKYVERLLEERG